MKLRWLLVIVAGCGHAPAKRQAEPSEPPPSCFLDGPSLAPAAPVSGYLDGTVHSGGFWYCELSDRVVIVDPTRDPQGRFVGDVVAIPRAAPAKLARAKIEVTSSCTDPCGNDGWAGCSMQASCNVTSTLAGAQDVVTTYQTGSPFAIQVIDNARCAPMTDTGVLAACSTATGSIIVRQDSCPADPHELTIAGLVYDGAAARVTDSDAAAAPSRTLAGDAPVVVDDTWTYDFGADASLVFHLGASPSATFTHDGTTEACFAFAITPY